MGIFRKLKRVESKRSTKIPVVETPVVVVAKKKRAAKKVAVKKAAVKLPKVKGRRYVFGLIEVKTDADIARAMESLIAAHLAV